MRLLFVCITVFSFHTSAVFSDWRVENLTAPGKVHAVRQSGSWVFIRIGSSWRKLVLERDGIRFLREKPPSRKSAQNAPPDGFVARTANSSSWYEDPTSRYPHGALGDRIEGGTLVVRSGGRRYDHVLPNHQVFEDIAPRIVDLDKDGRFEFVTIRAGARSGAAVVAYGIQNGDLSEIASSEPIGTPNRWLNIAGIADFNGDGNVEIAIVVKPHIQGTLELLELSEKRFHVASSSPGFSNHIYGDPELALSAIADLDADTVDDLVLPSFDRAELVGMTFNPDLGEHFRVNIPGKIKTAIGTLKSKRGLIFIFADENGLLYKVFRE